MSDGSNPFSPSFGVTPRVLAGRDAALAAFRDSFSGGAGAPARTVLVVGSRGYPYLVQAIGYCAWNASSGAAGITTAHVDRSLSEALGMYRANVLEQAWLDASPREREMPAVMAAISTTEPVSVAALSCGPRRRPAPGRRRRGTRRSRPARSRSGTRWPGT